MRAADAIRSAQLEEAMRQGGGEGPVETSRNTCCLARELELDSEAVKGPWWVSSGGGI